MRQPFLNPEIMKHLYSPNQRFRNSWTCAAALALGLTVTSVRAAMEFENSEGYGWFVRAGARALFGAKASVSRLPTTVTPGVYDDGFVLPDVGGTASGRTWNWGYDRANQVSGGQMHFSRLTDLPMAGLFTDHSSDPAMGGEIIVGAELARFFIHRREARLGFEIGYGYNNLTLDENSSAGGTATYTGDAYGLGGTAPPVAPYAGTFAGPGPLLNLQPSVHGVISSPSQSTFNGKLENNLHTFKLGVWMSYPVARRSTINLSAGYAAMYADSRLQFSERITFTSPAIPSIDYHDRTVSGRSWKPGAYAQFRFQYDFTRHWGAYVGGDFEYQERLQFQGEGREVTLDLNTLYAITAGMTFSF